MQQKKNQIREKFLGIIYFVWRSNFGAIFMKSFTFIGIVVKNPIFENRFQNFNITFQEFLVKKIEKKTFHENHRTLTLRTGTPSKISCSDELFPNLISFCWSKNMSFRHLPKILNFFWLTQESNESRDDLSQVWNSFRENSSFVTNELQFFLVDPSSIVQ